ncbi:MAG: NAD(+) synthase [Candidatus Paceibacterota bacterium]|jgi:NAD+ synthase
MIKNTQALEQYLIEKAREYGAGCEKVFVAVSGGIDSALVAAILVRAFGHENVIGLYRDIKSNPKHLADAMLLERALGFRLIRLDLNEEYDSIIAKTKAEFDRLGLDWADEMTEEAAKTGTANSYESLKSRFMTPIAGFVSKMIDNGRGRIFGTGNGEEDGLLRFFDKYGDGAVDNNLLAGLTKAEVRSLARPLGVPERIITKMPSADLQGNGDIHNDEDALSGFAKARGYDIRISYGSPDGSEEGNVAWAMKEDLKNGIITGACRDYGRDSLADSYGEEKADLILFLRETERATRHKVGSPVGTKREELQAAGLVD